MIDTAIALIPTAGPYGALVVVIVLYVVREVLSWRSMKALKTNDLHHIQLGIDAMRADQQELGGKLLEVLTAMQKDQALMHQTVGYIWQGRQP